MKPSAPVGEQPLVRFSECFDLFQENASEEEVELGRSVSGRDRHVRPPGREARVSQSAQFDFSLPHQMTRIKTYLSAIK